LERLNQWMTLFANMGVIAGIVFLAYQVQQGTEALEADTTATLMDAWLEGTRYTTENPELVELALRPALQGWDDFTPVEYVRLTQFIVQALKSAEFAHSRWIAGNLSDEVFRGQHQSMYRFMSGCAARGMWQTGVRYNFGQRFRDYVDGIVANSKTRSACDDLPEWAKADHIEIERMDASWNELLDTRASLVD
jgi:hypothetical protein